LGIIYFVVKVEESDCTSGTALPGDVTAPDSPDFGEILAIIWGFVPYACGLCCVLALVCRRRMWPLLLMSVAGVIVIVNEGVVKRVVKQDRPDDSCLHSKGMPSSHATLAITYWWWLHLEALIKPQLTSTSPWTSQNKATVLLMVWVLMFPVPFCRVVLHDHSWAQIGVGAAIGVTVSTCWFCFLYLWAYKHMDRIADFIGKCMCCCGCGNDLGCHCQHFVNDFYPSPQDHHESATQKELRTHIMIAEGTMSPTATMEDDAPPASTSTLDEVKLDWFQRDAQTLPAA